MRIWLLSIESIYTKKVGGLAEVPPRIGEELVNRGHEVLLITINNGFIRNEESFKLVFETSGKGVVYKAYLHDKPRVKHLIFTGGALDYEEVYSPRSLSRKVLEWSLTLRKYVEAVAEKGSFPDVIHANDWHSYPPLLAAKTVLDNTGAETRYIYQVHLISRNKFDLDAFSEYTGIESSTKVRGVYGFKSIKEYYELSRKGYIERMAALTVDKVLTVSKNYIIDILKRVGIDLSNNVDFVYNAITWSLNSVIDIAKKHNPDLLKLLNTESVLGRDRRILRRELLLKLRERIEVCPEIDDEESRKYVYSVSIHPFLGCGKVDSFAEDGPLVIMTGRLSKQKGIDVLIKATDLILSNLPELRVLLMPLPVWSEKRELESLIEYSIMFKDNVRVVFGKAPSIYGLAHLSANAMLAPSLYEPFGLMALEAMSTGTPVVASKTGGLAETVVDIESRGVFGTGLHCEPGSLKDLALKTVDLAAFMETQYLDPWSSEWWSYVDRLNSANLRRILLSNPDAPGRVRTSCLKRASEFTWAKSVDKLLVIYRGG